jgi:lipid-A-disaccharide synthase
MPSPPSPRGKGRPRILILAGEASGDLHGAHLARALRARFPEAELFGMGGERMQEAGVELFASLDRLAVMGFAEVVSRLPYFLALERKVKGILNPSEVDLVIPVDYPGFNLRMTRVAHERGIPVLFYIAPQVWAWKGHRARLLAEAADHVAVILPFEEAIFRGVGGKATYVGHPLLDEQAPIPPRGAFLEGLGLDPGREVLALFPGSRAQEIRRHGALFYDAADRILAARPGMQVVVAKASGLEATLPEALPSGAPVAMTGEGRSLLHHARGALIKSGTTTLEGALAGVPFVVAYRTHPLTWRIAQRVVRVDHVALANLVVNRRIVPELLQGAATPESLAETLLPLLNSGAPREAMLAGLEEIRAALGSPGAADRVARLAAEILEDRRP